MAWHQRHAGSAMQVRGLAAAGRPCDCAAVLQLIS